VTTIDRPFGNSKQVAEDFSSPIAACRRLAYNWPVRREAARCDPMIDQLPDRASRLTTEADRPYISR